MPTKIDMAKFAKFCKDMGFIFQSSEIYGGINGFWDYGPLGVELKRNIKEAWWQDMVRNPPPGPDGQEIRMVGARLLDHHEPEGLGGERTRRGVSATRWSIARQMAARAGSAPIRSPTAQCPLEAEQGARASSTEVSAHRAARLQPDVQDLRRGDSRRREHGRTSVPKRPRASSSTSRTCSTARGSSFRSASPRSARRFATRSRRGTSPSARASSSRWRSSSSAIRTSRGSGTSTGATGGKNWYTDARHQVATSCGCASRARTSWPTTRAARPTSSTCSRSPTSRRSWKASPIAATSTCAALEAQRQGPRLLRRGRLERAGRNGSHVRRRQGEARGGEEEAGAGREAEVPVRAARDRAVGRGGPGHAGVPVRGVQRGRGAGRQGERRDAHRHEASTRGSRRSRRRSSRS